MLTIPRDALGRLYHTHLGGVVLVTNQKIEENMAFIRYVENPIDKFLHSMWVGEYSYYTSGSDYVLWCKPLTKCEYMSKPWREAVNPVFGYRAGQCFCNPFAGGLLSCNKCKGE